MTIKILFVCLGNICRSPAAEGVFINKIKTQGIQDDFFVDSAGTGSWHVGNPADSRMSLAASKRGIHLPSIARQISKEDISTFDFILTMDNQNLKDVKLLSSQQSIVKKAELNPILTFASKTNLVEVPDPYYGGDKGFEDVLDLLDDACDGLLRRLKSND